jgi:hypothetical protein
VPAEDIFWGGGEKGGKEEEDKKQRALWRKEGYRDIAVAFSLGKNNSQSQPRLKNTVRFPQFSLRRAVLCVQLGIDKSHQRRRTTQTQTPNCHK